MAISPYEERARVYDARAADAYATADRLEENDRSDSIIQSWREVGFAWEEMARNMRRQEIRAN